MQEEAERSARRVALGLRSGSTAAKGMPVEPMARADVERCHALRRAWREAHEKIGLGARDFPDGRMEFGGTPPSNIKRREVVAMPSDEYARAHIED